MEGGGGNMLAMHIDGVSTHYEHTTAVDFFAEIYGPVVQAAEEAATGRGRANIVLLYHFNMHNF